MLKYISIWNKLIKPRVTSLVLVTSLPGLYLGGDGNPNSFLVGMTLLGTFFMSSASFILNQYIEIDRDARMERTKNRPLPMGEIKPVTALLVGLSFIIISFGILYSYANLLTALCALSGLLLYIFLYTIYLKPRTDQNIVIGGISGCIGPLIGYAAVTNTLPLSAWILFSMIFLWTPAHFWALAIFLKDDYDSAEFPMMPVVRGLKKTVQAIFIYTILYSISCIAFYYVSERVGLIYLYSTILLCILMIYLSVKLMISESKKFARFFFFFSIFHLYLVNFIILLDRKMI
ncbi:MAG: protoheme IX farnesyltransferase [Leptospiraceae bacterium]|nr:protoheme IX farnesyltransferase [Leptospiraceae bacterium]